MAARSSNGAAVIAPARQGVPALSPARIHSLQSLILGSCAALLTVIYAVEPLGIWEETTSADLQVVLGWMLGAVGVVSIGLRVALSADKRLAWGLIGLGVAGSAVAHLSTGLNAAPRGGIDLTEAGFLGSQLLALLGMGGLIFPLEARRLADPGLAAAALGLTAVWSWAILDPAVHGDGAAAVAAGIVALGLILAVVAVFASRQRNRCPETLIAGGSAAALGIAGCLYLTGAAEVLDEVWPLALAGFAAAPPLGARLSQRPLTGDNYAYLLGAVSVSVALGLLVVDHFARVPFATVLLAAATLIAAVAQIHALRRDREDAHQRAEVATERSRRAAAVALRARQSLSEQAALHAAALTAALDCVITVDERGRVIEWNDFATRMFGYRREQVLGRALAGLIVPERLRARHLRSLGQVLREPGNHLLEEVIETTAMRADGSEVPIAMRVVRTATKPPILTAFIRELEQRAPGSRSVEELEAIVESSEDAMISSTPEGLITRWNEAAERIFGYSAEEAVGQDLGDMIVPVELREQRESVLERVAQGETVAFESRRLRKDGGQIDVSMRVMPIRDDERVVGAAAIVRDITERRLLAERQRRRDEEAFWDRRIVDALERHRFEFFAQPVVDARTQELDHFELLLRMRTDERVVGPGEFLPFAESSGLIRRIDMWAVEEGLELARTRPVAINLSAKSFDNEALLPTIVGKLDAHAIDPADVTFEITETAAAENLEAATELCRALRGLGFGVALDDFGTGYGSFRYLQHLPVSELKVDMEFVRELAADPAESRVIRSIVGVAQNFGMRTVAEGVEDAETLERLVDLGVDLAQGYLVARPAPVGEAFQRPREVA